MFIFLINIKTLVFKNNRDIAQVKKPYLQGGKRVLPIYFSSTTQHIPDHAIDTI